HQIDTLGKMTYFLAKDLGPYNFSPPALLWKSSCNVHCLCTARKTFIVRAVDVRRRRETMAKTHLKLVTPVSKKRAVALVRRPNSELRSREHLTPTEVEKLIEATKGNRYGHRDETMLLVAYRHGLRASEVVDLRWEQIDWNAA